MSDRAESLRRFQQLARKVFEEMPEESHLVYDISR